MIDGTSIREVIEAKWDGTDEYVLSEPVRRELALMEAVVEANREGVGCDEWKRHRCDSAPDIGCTRKELCVAGRALTTYRTERGYVR